MFTKPARIEAVRAGFRLLGSMMAALSPLLFGGCGETPVASVANVGFTEDQIRGLSEAQMERLVLITTVGIASARGEVLQVGAPVIERAREDIRIARLRQERALEEAGVTDAVLRARYDLNPEHELTVRHLVVLSERSRTDGERAEARARAEDALARARAGEPFPALAGEVSEEPGALERGGLLEPGREGSWVSEFWDAASLLDEGEISGVVESEYGFHVLKLEERTTVPFEEARRSVVAEVAAALPPPSLWPSLPSLADEGVRARLLAEADDRGISVSEPEMAVATRDWELRMAGWAAAFGFVPGLAADEIAEQSVAALGSTTQGARIARDEILAWEGTLATAYPVSLPES